MQYCIQGLHSTLLVNKHTFIAIIFHLETATWQLACSNRPPVQKSKFKTDVNDAVIFSVTLSPAAQRTCPAMGTRTRTILPRSRRPRRTRAPRPATAPLLPTAWLPGASRERGPTSSQPLRVSGAWRKCAASSPLFKVGVSSLNHVFFLFLANLCAHPCASYAPAFFFVSLFLCSGCEELAAQFLSQEIDGQALLLLREDHLISTMNIKLGPALKICASINTLRE